MKLHFKTLLYTCLLSLGVNQSLCALPLWKQNISKSIVQNSRLNIGIRVQSMRTGNLLYQYNVNRVFEPASIQKLFIATAALTYLKPDYQFTTELLTNQDVVKNKTLSGNLYIKFSGDPMLTHQNLNELIGDLNKLNIKHIAGNIYLDNSQFDQTAYGPGWQWDDLSYGYAAPLNAMIVDKNHFVATIIPNAKLNHYAKIIIDPKSPYIHIHNTIKTVGLKQSVYINVYSTENNHYVFSGQVARNPVERYRVLAVRNITPYIEHIIREDLKAHQINFSGKIKIRKIPSKVTLLAGHKSPELREMIVQMLKHSDNLIADSLLKTLGADYYHVQGNWQNGVMAMKKVLSKAAGISFKNSLIVDGAGLSRYNLISPLQVSELLNYAYHNFAISPELMSALPIAGYDGTLKKRMKIFKQSGNVRGKTGSMTGVNSLAGYMTTKRGEILSYVIMMNGFVGSYSPQHKVQREILKSLTTA